MIRRKILLSLASVVCCSALAIGARNLQKDDTSSLVGKPAPAFAAETITGSKVSLADEKGNVVLMDFWATWCPPCRKSLPHIQELANDKELASQGLKVWAVDTAWNGESKEKAAKFVKTNKYTFTVPLDKNDAAAKDFKANAIPCTVLIGRDGTVKQVWIGFDPDGAKEMKKTIEDALKERKSS